MKGWIYVFTNDSIPGFVKIDVSQIDPEIFISELNKAGLPTPYKLEIEFLVFDLEKTQKTISEKIQAQSAKNGWYKIDPKLATIIIGSCLTTGEQNLNEKYLEISFSRSVDLARCADAEFRIKTPINPQLPLKVFDTAIEIETNAEIIINALKSHIAQLSDAKIISILTKHQDKSVVTAFIVSHESTSLAVLKFILSQRDWGRGVPLINFTAWNETNLSELILSSPKIDSETLHMTAIYHQNYSDWDKFGRFICIHENCSFETLAHLCYFFNFLGDDLNVITTHKEWDNIRFKDYLFDLVDSGNDELEGVASHQLCPAELLVQISTADEYYHEEAIKVALDNPNNPIYIAKNSTNIGNDILYLSSFGHQLVKEAIAGNKTCPDDILIKFSLDLDVKIRSAVASNEICPPFVLENLCVDPSIEIRNSVSRNTNATPEVLLKMSSEMNSEIIHNLYSRIDSPPDLLRALSVHHFWPNLLSRNPNTPEELLIVIASNGSLKDRIAIAERVDCPLKIMPKPINDPSALVRKALLNNNECSTEAFLIAANSPIFEWRAAAAGSINCPISILLELSLDSVDVVSRSAKSTLKNLTN